MQKRERKRAKITVNLPCWDFVRDSIERYLNTPPFSRDLQISTDSRFARSNLMLDAQVKKSKTNRQRKHRAQACYRGRRPPEAEIKRSVVLVVTAFLAEERVVSCRHAAVFFCGRGLEGERSSVTTNGFKFETDAAGEITQP